MAMAVTKGVLKSVRMANLRLRIKALDEPSLRRLLLLPLQDEVVPARIEPQFRRRTAGRAPAERQELDASAERPGLDPWQRTRHDAVEGKRDPL